MSDDPLLARVLAGLASTPRTLPPTLFYDDAGSALFERITRLEAYDLTRNEAAVWAAHGREIAAAAAGDADGVVVIEPGSGGGGKALALLRHLPARAYVGVDVSAAALDAGVARLADALPGLAVFAVHADYHEPYSLPALPAGRRIAFFPGSTLGNFDPPDAVAFLAHLRALAQPGGAVIVGIDLWRDVGRLRRAYDDPEGVTAAFNKNALRHLNARYGADFDPDRFAHDARVDEVRRRVEMHLRVLTDHDVHLSGRTFRLRAGETLHTENAYKVDLPSMRALAASAGLVTERAWTDPSGAFAVVVHRA